MHMIVCTCVCVHEYVEKKNSEGKTILKYCQIYKNLNERKILKKKL